MLQNRFVLGFSLALVLLAGCSTPVVVLRDYESGAVVTCVGEKSDAAANALTADMLRLGPHERCAEQFEGRGFRRVPVAR